MSTLPQVIIVPMAVADTTGCRDIHLDMRGHVGHVATSFTRLNGMDGFTETIRVDCVALDDFCAEWGVVPGFVKVDVEGAEPLVFAGAERLLRDHRPILVFEMWETWWDKGFAELWRNLERWYVLKRLRTVNGVSDVVAVPA